MSTLVGVIQLCSTENKKENFACAKPLITEAASKGAKMVFLPECFDFVGPSKSFTIENAEPLDGPVISDYKKLAIESKLWISLGGSHRKADDADNRVYNTHVVINAEGQIVATYDKIHLFDVTVKLQTTTQNSDTVVTGASLLESSMVRPGQNAPPVVRNTPIGHLGLAICYDVRFPELAAYLRYVGGAQILAYPSAFTLTTGRAGHWHSLLCARAIENQCYVIAAAQEGAHNPKRTSYGHSLVVDPWGQIIAEQLNPGPGLLLCEFPSLPDSNSAPNLLSNVRQSFPVSSHRRFDLFLMQDSGSPIDIGTDNYAFGPHTILSECVFYRSPSSFAFVNLSPLVPGHVLVCPVMCVPRIDGLSPGQLADLYLTVKRVSAPLALYFQASSLTVSTQDGKDAGQTVPHAHVHVLPRKPNDFAQNDDIYVALEKHDKSPNRVMRSMDVMIAEAKEFRKLFYGANP